MPGGQGWPVHFVEVYYWLDRAASTRSRSRQQEAIQARNTVAARLLRIRPKHSSELSSGRLRIRNSKCPSGNADLASSSAHGHAIELDGRHAYADGYALAIFAAGADAFIELEVVADH
jgi:hypothetical protein